jgi:cellulose synthase/poly-beta-1,6-N-acetylglucosamine synthase-like glycosyltransferase
MINSLPKEKSEKDISDTLNLPEVGILMAAYNEEKVIGEKIKSVMEGNYPLEKITFLIGSDASTDKTDSIVNEYALRYPQIKLISFKGRTGKSGIVNELTAQCNCAIFILTDANVLFERNTIQNLIRHFSDPKKAQVCANIIKVSGTNTGIANQEKSYIALENKIKYSESLKWKVVMGAEGGCYAIRKENFKPVPPKFFMDDFYVTMNVIEQGKEIVFDPDAICYEDVPTLSEEEFKRKVRISIGNFQNLVRYMGLLFNFNSVSFAFFSHKVLRWLTPFFLLKLLFVSICLSFGSPFFRVLTILQMCGILLPIIDSAANFTFRPLKFISHFYLMNFALLKGFFIYIGGVDSNIWQPTKRNV